MLCSTSRREQYSITPYKILCSFSHFEEKFPLVCIALQISTLYHSPGIFNCMLHFIYGCDSLDIGQGFNSECGLNENMRDIIKAATIYGLINLKLRAEVFHVLLLPEMIDFDTFMDHLHFANPTTCIYFRKRSWIFVENKIKILDKKMLAGALESKVYDILLAVARREIDHAAGARKTNALSAVSISELRRRAHARGLEVDGSREMLILSLKNDAPAPANDNP